MRIDQSFADDLVARPLEFVEDLAPALAQLRREDAVSLPLLSARACQRLCAATAHLTFRPATPSIGQGERIVYQDFTLTMSFPSHSLFKRFAATLGQLVDTALDRLDPRPLDPPLCFNDLIVQRYPKGSRGITPHRDHIRYTGLVALVTLAGAARFFVCRDRSGRDAQEVPCPPGHLLLMRAPSYDRRDDRPFHFLCDITRPRLGLGLRHDTRAEVTVD